MKHKSFLFFILFIFLFTFKNVAQQQPDSLFHYYNLFTKADNNEDLLKSYRFYSRHKDLSIEVKDISSTIQYLRYMASIEYRLGLLNESEDTSIESLKLINKLSSKEEQNKIKIGVYNHIGILNKNMNDYDRAMEMYQRVLQISSSQKSIHIVINNIGNIYKMQGKYNLAKNEYDKCISYFFSSHDTINYAKSLSNLGLVKSKLDIKSGLSDIEEAFELRKRINKKTELYASYIDFGIYYLNKENKSIAINYFKKAYNISIQLNNHQDQITTLSYLIDCGDISKIFLYKSLKDTIDKQNKKMAYRFASIKFDYNEEQKKLVQSELLKEKESRLKTTSQITVVFVIILGFVLYQLLRTKHKKEKLQQVYITETRISKKVHDEVANDIYQIMTKIQSDNTHNEIILDDLEGIYIKTRDISKENSNINVNDNFEKVLNDLLLSYKSDTVNVITKNNSKIDWKSISKIKKITIYRVLQELMTNMKKHSKASIVVLVFSNDKKLIINYKDNGIGCKLNKNTGLQNVENRINSIQGLVTFESEINNGFRSIITI